MAEKKKKKRKNPLTPALVVMAFSLFLTVLICLVLIVVIFTSGKGGLSLFEHESKSEPASEEPVPVTYSQSEVDEMVEIAKAEGASEKESEIKTFIQSEAESNNPSFATVLRKMYPESIVYSGDGRFYFEPIDDSIPKSKYARENYVTEDNGFRYYDENGERKSTLCLDVSAHQGSIDWPKVASSGVTAVMIRAGYRGYGSGKMVEDEKVHANIAGARANNIEAGIYFFSQAINEAEVDEEVEVLLEIARTDGANGPIAIDVEKLDADTARGNALSAEERTHLTIYFCEKIKEAGYEPMIYGNAYSLFHMLNYNEIKQYKIWYAFYSDFNYFPYNCHMWQYSSTGSVPGISGDVDLNVRYVPPAQG
ncbi:MAG: glycoside hydrolase family 25 protein [Lachnospiraceae bacterium]|nr:glycoside hydrolase family 25 protein [Lachnospiraceae bacterium]